MKTGTNDAIAATATRPNWLDAPNMVFRMGVTATIGTTAIAATRGASMPSIGRAAAARPANRIAEERPGEQPEQGVGRRDQQVLADDVAVQR